RKRAKGAGAHAGIVPGIGVGQVVVAFALVPGNALFGVSLCGLKFPRETERAPAEMMGLDKEVGVAHVPRQVKDMARFAPGRSHVTGDHVVLPFAAQRDEQSADVIDLAGDLGCAGERRRDLRIAKTPRWHKANAESVLQGDFAMMARCRLWQGSEEFQ